MATHCDGIIPATIGVRASVAVPGNGRIDQARVDGREICIAKAHRVELAGDEVLDASLRQN